MREIKFRFWYKKENRWLDNVRIDNNGDIYPIDSNGEEDSTIDCLQVEKSQFTGLHDKNGKEIYEGDILTSTFGKGLPSQIKFGEFHDYVEIDFNEITFVGFYFHEQTGETTAFGKSIYGNTECFEIVGNIYESPELLK